MTEVDGVEEKKKCLAGCGEKETVEHLLTCPLYGRERQMIRGGGADILKLLNEDPAKVLEFLISSAVRPLPTCPKDRESTERERESFLVYCLERAHDALIERCRAL